jgi:glycosyltransferase involved in cell wall biosynthesis
MPLQFRVIIPVFNVAEAVGESIAMLRRQSHSHFRCLLIDDLSTDDTVDVVRDAIAGDDRFELVVNHEKKYALRNAVEAIGEICKHADEVIVPVDGDDCLMHADVLAHVADTYASEDCWLTYGSYINERGERGRECSAYPSQVTNKGTFRKHRWHATHLKTFKYGLWQHVPSTDLRATPEEFRMVCNRAVRRGQFRAWRHWRRLRCADLHDPSGQCFRRCYDKAIMYPMLELAGARAAFVPEILYSYRSCNPGSGTAARSAEAKWGTRGIQQMLRLKPRLHPLQAL